MALFVALLLVVSGLVLAVGSAGPAAAAGSCSSPVGPGQIRVVVVVDPGDGGPAGPTSTCLIVDADGKGNLGSNVLAQRAALLGRASPRYAGSGLLCGIDGYPGDGCPTNSGGTYDYWAYFNSTGGGWSYGSDNPFVRRMRDGEIMGWRYSKGVPDGQAPAPRIAASSSLFPPLVTPPPPAPPAPPAGGSGGSGGTAGGGPAGDAPLTDAPTLPDGSAPDAAAAVGATPESTPAENGADTADDVGDADGTVELAAEPTSASGTGSDAGRWLGVAIVVAAIGAL
ncbi:MAG TPA: hypothetical protein VIY72_01135, partial [Acidimicrobiales bacterium]